MSTATDYTKLKTIMFSGSQVIGMVKEIGIRAPKKWEKIGIYH